jgi:hypothetical protein
LAHSPGLAAAEIAMRVNYMIAYLRRVPLTHPAGAAHTAARPNQVLLRMTERSGQASFGYRVGMTMTDWVARRLVGLASTTHAEHDAPPEAGTAWKTTKSLPDLYGRDGANALWLLEAKGGRKVRQGDLRKGVSQLTTPRLVKGTHNKLLCGASVEDRLFVTIDVADPQPFVPWPEDLSAPPDLDHLRSRLLLYLALYSLPDSARHLVRFDFDDWQTPRMTQLPTSPLPTLDDAAGGDQRPTAQDFVVGLIPRTGITFGMPARTYLACERLIVLEEEYLPGWARAVILDTTSQQGSSIDFGPSAADRRASIALRAVINERRDLIYAELVDHVTQVRVRDSRRQLTAASASDIVNVSTTALIARDAFMSAQSQT